MRNLLVLLVALAACGETTELAELPDAPITPPQPDAAEATCDIALDATFTGMLAVTTDDHTKLFVNGALVDDVVRFWHEPQLYAVTLFRHPSRTNVIAIEGRNSANQDGVDRGVLADLRFDVAGTPHTIVSDAAWRVSGTLTTGWEAIEFDDAAFPTPVVIGPADSAPWFDVFATLAPGTTASWIWVDDPNRAAIEKPTDQTTFARRAFSVIDPSCI